MIRRPLLLACLVALVVTSCTGLERAVGPKEPARAAAVATTAPDTTALPPVEAPSTAPPPPPSTATVPPPPPTTDSTFAPAPVVPVPMPPRKPVVRRASPTTGSFIGGIVPYAGLGTWVDVYDWSHYKNTTPTVGPAQVDQMAAEGVETLFLQTAKHDTPELISEPELLLPIIDRAQDHGMFVVAWYLPTLEDVTNDLNRLVASAALGVDGLAVDIESRKVADVNERNARLIDLSARLTEALPDRAIGAIVMPPVQLEVVNPKFWPGFPYREIAPYYDVWQTMGYWTDRKKSSGYRDPYRYTDENIRRLRANLGDPAAPVAPVGGVGAVGAADVDAFHRAAVENGALGGSIYDFRTTKPEAWPSLRKFRSTR